MVVTQAITPTTPRKVWKTKPVVEGVPSMFAGATLSKPLKINAAATAAVRRKPVEAAPAPTPVPMTRPQHINSAYPVKSESKTKNTPLKVNSAATKTVQQKSKAATPLPAQAASTAETKPSTNAATWTGLVKSDTKPKRNTSASNNVTVSKQNTSTSNNVVGFGSTVAGTPRSWPKPHEVTPEDKPVIRPKKQPQQQKVAQPKNIDALIPEMYRKKNTKQLEKEQQAEIQKMREIMFQLRMLEREREERALQPVLIENDIKTALKVLEVAKLKAAADDDSDDETKRSLAYSTHIKSKLAFFNSNHSVSLGAGDDDSDSSSVSSWDSDSDSDDGLFRG